MANMIVALRGHDKQIAETKKNILEFECTKKIGPCGLCGTVSAHAVLRKIEIYEVACANQVVPELLRHMNKKGDVVIRHELAIVYKWLGRLFGRFGFEGIKLPEGMPHKYGGCEIAPVALRMDKKNDSMKCSKCGQARFNY